MRGKMAVATVFALGSVTALTGFVVAVAAAGCSSTIGGFTSEGGTSQGGGGDAKVPIKPAKEAGDPDPPDPDDAATGGSCPTTDPIDQTTAPWKPPRITAGACTNAEIDALVAFNDNNPGAQYSAVKASVPAGTCKTCLFAPDGATWAPFVEKADGSFLRNNFGGCVAKVSGKDSCGKAFSQYDDCLSFACQDCADQTSFDACGGVASKGACKAGATALTTECPTIDPITTCDNLATKYLFESAARALCVGP